MKETNIIDSNKGSYIELVYTKDLPIEEIKNSLNKDNTLTDFFIKTEDFINNYNQIIDKNNTLKIKTQFSLFVEKESIFLNINVYNILDIDPRNRFVYYSVKLDDDYHIIEKTVKQIGFFSYINNKTENGDLSIIFDNIIIQVQNYIDYFALKDQNIISYYKDYKLSKSRKKKIMKILDK